MARIYPISVAAIERWKRWLLYARSLAFAKGDREFGSYLGKILDDIEHERALGKDSSFSVAEWDLLQRSRLRPPGRPPIEREEGVS